MSEERDGRKGRRGGERKRPSGRMRVLPQLALLRHRGPSRPEANPWFPGSYERITPSHENGFGSLKFQIHRLVCSLQLTCHVFSQ
ncbi:hypothetical protein BCY86_00670 [Pajaroellobacter abortibovis]|uniref:Uncharacterized protein n=1 Tax=Pajaroellobacter abortibovis TaxID=1882918 RepID=A0A1L6MV12_9BACT|nr:hypothetical protein BCY86_00670 [Pajaroellobacter abortibovis]